MTAVAIPFLAEASKQFLQDEKLNVELLDRVVQMMNCSSGEEQKQANAVLMQLKQDPNAWTKVDVILQHSNLSESKYFALQILENAIQTKWKTLPDVQRDGIKTFIVSKILELSASKASMESNQLLLDKLNLVLVQIVKQEWPKNWPSFITDIVESSKTSESICVNNMKILALFSEEVFDFGSQYLTEIKERMLKMQFCGQFQEVFNLCVSILEKCPSNYMVHATLKTMHRFLSWIPVGYVYETDIIKTLSENFLSLDVYRVITLQCLTEIAHINIENLQYDKVAVGMFCTVMKEISNLLGPNPDLASAYKQGSDQDQKFISVLAMFLTAFFKEHIQRVEVTDLHPTEEQRQVRMYHSYALDVLLSISMVEDTEIFKVCLEFWLNLTAEMYRVCPFRSPAPICVPGILNRGMDSDHPKKVLYRTHLSELRSIMICRMAKPEEVLVVENDQGEVVREIVKDTDTIALYRTMRETLVYLVHLDPIDTEQKMTEKLNYVQTRDFSWKNLNTLCWAIGSISGTMMEEDEKKFLVLVIRDLLGLCEQKRGKENKAVIASNIMYVVGQYPRFLRAHWKFLKTVINKLFEFMHETHEGVQDMACDTFIKIAIKCKRHFVILQNGESAPFIEVMLNDLTGIISDLTPPQVHVFYEAVGHIISAQMEPPAQEKLIEKLMALPNAAWTDIMTKMSEGEAVFEDIEMMKSLLNILKTNVAACKAIGNPFIVQLGLIYIDSLSAYKLLSEKLSQAVQKNGEDVLRLALAKVMKSVKREILIFISTWVAKSVDAAMVLENIVPPLFDAVLFDYQRNVAQAREPKVLSLLSIIVTRLENMSIEQVPTILDAVFSCTLEMINKDMEAYPEHRTNFFQLLLSMIQQCFPVFLQMPRNQFQLVIDAVVWAFQHTMRNVAEIGLDILKEILSQVSELPDEESQPFYKNYYMSILNHVLAVVCDSNQVHVAGLSYYASVLCALFRAPEFNIKVPLNDANPQQANMDYIFENIGVTFSNHFTNLHQDQIRVIIKGFFSYNTRDDQMRTHLKDFLVQLKETVGADTSDLYLEEREKEIVAAQEQKKFIPGLVNPNELPDEDDMR